MCNLLIKNVKLFVVVLLVFMIVSCKKDIVIPEEILTSKSWKRALSDVNPATNPPGNVLYYGVQQCEKDDTFTFSQDGIVTINKGTDKCDGNEMQIERITYNVNRSSKTLTIAGTSFMIAEESQQQIKYYVAAPPGTPYQYIVFLLQ